MVLAGKLYYTLSERNTIISSGEEVKEEAGFPDSRFQSVLKFAREHLVE